MDSDAEDEPSHTTSLITIINKAGVVRTIVIN